MIVLLADQTSQWIANKFGVAEVGNLMPRHLNYKESKTEFQGATKQNAEGIFPQGLDFAKIVVLRKPNQKKKNCK